MKFVKYTKKAKYLLQSFFKKIHTVYKVVVFKNLILAKREFFFLKREHDIKITYSYAFDRNHRKYICFAKDHTNNIFLEHSCIIYSSFFYKFKIIIQFMNKECNVLSDI